MAIHLDKSPALKRNAIVRLAEETKPNDPIKRLQIHVQDATNLPLLGRKRRAPNAYVIIHLADKLVFQSDIVKDGQNPSWHENSPVFETRTSVNMTIRLYHRSRWPKADILLGESIWRLKSLIDAQGLTDLKHFVTTNFVTKFDDYHPKMTLGVREVSSKRTFATSVSEAKERRASLSLTNESLKILAIPGPNALDASKEANMIHEVDNSPSTSTSGLSASSSSSLE